jgi:hypothetical protein
VGIAYFQPFTVIRGITIVTSLTACGDDGCTPLANNDEHIRAGD